MHLKDLLYTTEGNDDWADKLEGLLNLHKVDCMGKIVATILRPKYEHAS